MLECDLLDESSYDLYDVNSCYMSHNYESNVFHVAPEAEQIKNIMVNPMDDFVAISILSKFLKTFLKKSCFTDWHTEVGKPIMHRQHRLFSESVSS